MRITAAQAANLIDRMRARHLKQFSSAEAADLAARILRRFPDAHGFCAVLVSIEGLELTTVAEVEATMDRILSVNTPRPRKPHWRGDGWCPTWMRRDPRWFGRAARWYVPVLTERWLACPWPACGPLSFAGDADRVTEISLHMACTPEDVAVTARRFRREVRQAGLLAWPDSASDAAALARYGDGPVKTDDERRGRRVRLFISPTEVYDPRDPPEHTFSLRIKATAA